MPAALRVRFFRKACRRRGRSVCPGRPLPGWCSRHRARVQSLAHDKREQRRSVSPATRSAVEAKKFAYDKYPLFSPEPASDSDAGPGADADAGPRADHQLGDKTGFPPRTWPYPHALPSAAARKTQGARAHPPISLDRPSRPSFVTSTFVTLVMLLFHTFNAFM